MTAVLQNYELLVLYHGLDLVVTCLRHVTQLALWPTAQTHISRSMGKYGLSNGCLHLLSFCAFSHTCSFTTRWFFSSRLCVIQRREIHMTEWKSYRLVWQGDQMEIQHVSMWSTHDQMAFMSTSLCPDIYQSKSPAPFQLLNQLQDRVCAMLRLSTALPLNFTHNNIQAQHSTCWPERKKNPVYQKVQVLTNT